MQKKEKMKVKNEFRFNKNTHHPAHVFGETDKKYKAVGITHEPTTFGKKNMPLEHNPRKTDTKKAYIRNGIISDKKENFSKKTIKNLSFSQSDFAKVKSKERNYKKRQKKKASSKRR